MIKLLIKKLIVPRKPKILTPTIVKFKTVTNCKCHEVDNFWLKQNCTEIILRTWSVLRTGEDYPRMIHMCPEKAA